jgi:hypothetical protein
MEGTYDVALQGLCDTVKLRLLNPSLQRRNGPPPDYSAYCGAIGIHLMDRER